MTTRKPATALTPTPFETFYRDQIRTPSTAVALAIADHKANGSPIWEYVEQLQKAQDRCDAYPRLVRALGKAADQIAYLQELSGTDKYGPLDALAEARALLSRLK